MLAMLVIDLIIKSKKIISKTFLQKCANVRRVRSILGRQAGVHINLLRVFAVEGILHVQVESRLHGAEVKLTVNLKIKRVVPRRRRFIVHVFTRRKNRAQRPAEIERGSAKSIAEVIIWIVVAAVETQQSLHTHLPK